MSRHSSASMNVSVTVRPMTFETTVPSVLVTACCAPMTSLLRRDINAPVCVRVKNDDRQPLHVVEQLDPHVVDEALADARGEVPLHQAEDGVREREADGRAAEEPDQLAVLVGDRVVEEAPEQQRRDRGHHGVEHDADEEPDQEGPVGPGELQHATEQGPLDLAALHGVGVTPETHHRLVRLHDSLIPSDPTPT